MNALEKYSLITHIAVVIGLILFLIMIIFYWPFNISEDERPGWLLAGFARWVFGILSLAATIWLILEIDEQVKDILAS